MGQIYKIKNIENGMVYIGSAKNAFARFDTHMSQLENGKHYNQELQADFNDLGKDSFEFKIIDEVDERYLRWKELDNIFGYDQLYKIYNVITDKDKIVYAVCRYLSNQGWRFRIDYKVKVKGKRMNINLVTLVNDSLFYFNLRDKRYIDEKSEKNNELKLEHIKHEEKYDGYVRKYLLDMDYNGMPWPVEWKIDQVLDYIKWMENSKLLNGVVVPIHWDEEDLKNAEALEEANVS
ncbi:GIY-YIG nuclease family protein [Candidatus Contubernalis alkaliaceticus]|uniref:GIY-YIG nuclease family protein n=1 Tax=Candidatus Contubernalis alkaliaceticus TaxID=338645 RepID=UPI001F4C2218|nr:GIY-YIG nuclease family protein [Candidatus Contubernalis alkalaceticus]UNC92729.1 GIY-YIG nuclease family protein [Candidatus Contubernalis alkalaceticus]